MSLMKHPIYPTLPAWLPCLPLHRVRVRVQIPEGKGENSFAFEGKWLGAAEALKVRTAHRCGGETGAAGRPFAGPVSPPAQRA